jgi:zinc protease
MTFMKRVVLSLAFGLAVVGACSGPGNPLAPAAEAQTIERPKGWAKDRGNLPADPDYTLGALPNGLRYLILPNKLPPGQVAMRLVIPTGSMQEVAGQEGIAHFLEHLAFRGTTKFPDGEVQRVLERLGLSMGADVNASTGADSTTFKLDMARNDPVSLDTGLMVLREFASEMSLDQDKVDAERGVVLAEERLRATPELEVAQAQARAQIGDHPMSRAPIGYRKVIETLTAEQIRAFYETWYRPDRATIVIVGDIDPQAAITNIKARFNDWAPHSAGKVIDPAPVMKRPAGSDVTVNVVPGASDTRLAMIWTEPYRESEPTKAYRRKLLVDQLGQEAIGRRMLTLTEEAGRPARYVSGPVGSRVDRVWTGLTASAGGVIDLDATLALMVRSQQQAKEHGVTQAELDRVIALRIEAAKQNVAADKAAPSVQYADGLARAVVGDPVFVSPEQSLALLQEQTRTIKLKEVNAALKAHLSGEPALVYIGPDEPKGGEAGLRASYAAAKAQKSDAYVSADVKPWPYTDFGPVGKVATRKEIADLGVTFVTFENGVKLTIKPTKIQKNDVLIQARLGLGRLGMPRDRIDASDMGAVLWSTGGYNKLTRPEQARTLAGRRVIAGVDSADDAYVISNGNGGYTPATELPLQMEVLAAMVSDPAYRTDDWAALMSGSDRSEAALPFSPGGVARNNVDKLLHSGDLRWVFNTAEMRKDWKPEDSIKYIRPIVEKSPIEVIIVGDVTVDAAIKETARTFGALPPRKEIPEPPGLRDVKFPKGGDPITLTHKGRGDQAMVMFAWPTQGLYSSIRSERIGQVLAQLVRDRATIRFRTDKSATYSPTSTVEFSDILPNYGLIALMVEITPDMVDGVIEDINAITADLAAYPLPVSELTRVIQPRIEMLKREREGENSYWMNALAHAQDNPKVLEAIRTRESDYLTLTPADIQAAAKVWMRPDATWIMKIVPEKPIAP